MQGRLNFDEICCKTGKSYMELESIVEKDENVYVCWKWSRCFYISNIISAEIVFSDQCSGHLRKIGDFSY